MAPIKISYHWNKNVTFFPIGLSPLQIKDEDFFLKGAVKTKPERKSVIHRH